MEPRWGDSGGQVKTSQEVPKVVLAAEEGGLAEDAGQTWRLPGGCCLPGLLAPPHPRGPASVMNDTCAMPFGLNCVPSKEIYWSLNTSTSTCDLIGSL